MSGARGFARGEFTKAKRKQIHEGHQVIDSCHALCKGAKAFAHMVVDKLFALNYPHISASCETLARWLEEDKAIRGCRYRLGSRGPAKTGPRRPTLSRETIRRYVHQLQRAGLLEQIGGGRAVGARYAGKKPRGLRWWLRPSGLLWDALRGAYKPWREEFQRTGPEQIALALPDAVASLPPPVRSSLHLGSTILLPEEKQKERAAPLTLVDVPALADALAPPRTIEKSRSPHSVIQRNPDDPSDDEHAARLRRLQSIAVDTPAPDPDSRE